MSRTLGSLPSPAIKQSILTKNKLYKKFVKKTISFGHIYRAYRNHLTRIIQTAKNDYYKVKLSNCDGNIRGTWKVLNKILNKKNTDTTNTFKINNIFTDDKEQIAHNFNKYFSTIGKETSSKLRGENTNFTHYLPNNNHPQIIWENTNSNEVKRIIQQSKSSSPGHDSIPMKIFKNNVEIFAPIISHLCNLSIRDGIFPSIHKIGKVIPLYKKDAKYDFENYRPICLLNSISKI